MSNMTAMTEEKTEQQVKETVLNWVKVGSFSSINRRSAERPLTSHSRTEY